MTGVQIEGTPASIELRSDELDRWRTEVFGPVVAAPTEGAASMTDFEILERATGARNGAKVRRLLAGDTSGYDSQSEADLALASLLAFYSQDEAQVDRLMRGSGLHRQKWERSTYRAPTISKALRQEPRPAPPPRAQLGGDTLADSDSGALPVGVEHAGRARLYDLSKYNASAEAACVDWLIEDWLVRGQTHLTAAREKKGKTTKAIRRMAAVSTGAPYLGGPTRLGRTALITEMDEAGVLQLIADDNIELDWSRARIIFTNEYPPEERLGIIEDVCKEWAPDHLVLDPADETFGLDGDAIFNPSKAGSPFDVLRTWARTGITFDLIYHLNNVGRIANSYKFRSKPDHIYEMVGEDASDIRFKYHGRLRAIARVRRVTGNGHDGYRVETLVGGSKPIGRPAETAPQVLTVLMQSELPLGPQAIATATGQTAEAVRAALQRLVRDGAATRLDRGLYEAAPREETASL